jgi:phospholipid/cholesterol/gamma-HCH transport system substrate-binding protein
MAPRFWPRKKAARHEHSRRSNVVVGLIVLFVVVIGIYVAFAKMTKWFPFELEGQTVRAVFDNSATLRPTSPVRIAGVNVGEVTSVEELGEQAEVTFTVSEDGLPIHEDATAEIRPRLFLEGNFFLDVEPGSPSAPELGEGETLPVTQTAVAVQLDEVLAALDQPARADLRDLLEGYGTALTYQPTTADDADQDPDVRGETGAEAINDSFVYGGDAGRDTAIANTALLGTEPHDLSRLIRGQARVSGALVDREHALQELLTNFNVTAGAFAAESGNLAETIRLLAPTLEEATPALRRVDRSLPPLRRLAIESTPGIEELPATIAASQPWLDQTAALLAKDELGAIASLIERSTPNLAEATNAGAELMPQIELFSRCVSDVLVPTGDIVIDDEFSTGQPNFRELFYSAVDQAGESQDFDGNGQYVRVNPGGGEIEARSSFPGELPPNDFVYTNLVVPTTGTQPVLGEEPPLRGDFACHRNAVPDLNGVAAAVGPPSPEVSP